MFQMQKQEMLDKIDTDLMRRIISERGLPIDDDTIDDYMGAWIKSAKKLVHIIFEGKEALK